MQAKHSRGKSIILHARNALHAANFATAAACFKHDVSPEQTRLDIIRRPRTRPPSNGFGREPRYPPVGFDGNSGNRNPEADFGLPKTKGSIFQCFAKLFAGAGVFFHLDSIPPDVVLIVRSPFKKIPDSMGNLRLLKWWGGGVLQACDGPGVCTRETV